MPLWTQVIAVIVVLTVIVVPLLILSERRSWQRVESWHCPDCGSVFGARQQRRFWGVKRDPNVAGLPIGGPILNCSRCQRDFAFDGDGRQVDDRREYVHRTA